MNFSIARRFAFVLASVSIFFAALPALAQRSGGGGGGGRASASSSAHFGGGGSASSFHPTPSTTSHAASSGASSSNAHVYSASSAASSPAAHTSFSARSSSGGPAGTPSAHATSAYSSSIPRNVTIGFLPRATPIAPSRTAAANGSTRATTPLPRSSHMSFYGDGNEIWAEPSPAAATPRATSPANLILYLAPPLPSHLSSPSRANTENQNQIQPRGQDARATKTEPPAAKPHFGNPIATPPARPRHPIFGGNGFGSGGNSGTRGFGGFFSNFGWGFNSWDTCNPSWAFGCNSFADPVNGAVWDPSTTWYPADDSGDASSCGDPCTTTWQDPPAPAQGPDQPPQQLTPGPPQPN
jgi:hypothetical protein